MASVLSEADQSFANGKTTSQLEARPGLRRKLITWVKFRLPFCL